MRYQRDGEGFNYIRESLESLHTSQSVNQPHNYSTQRSQLVTQHNTTKRASRWEDEGS
jgi:hypothetical protein